MRISEEIASAAHTANEALSEPIRVCVVDDQAILRESLAELLEFRSGLEVVARCAAADGARHILSYKRVDIVLIHFDAERQRVFSLLKQLEEAMFKGRVVVMAGSLPDSDVLRLVSHRVAGILSNESSPEQLVNCIRKVTAGEFWFDHFLLRIIIAASVDVLRKMYSEPFTDREKILMRAVVQGLTNKEIAVRMDLEESAVKAAFRRIFKKIGVHSRGQLLRVALAQFGEEFQ